MRLSYKNVLAMSNMGLNADNKRLNSVAEQ